MKDQYFGDINDYRKYGLLRTLAGAGLSVGVCWLLTCDDGGGDGELWNYLTKPWRWRKYDPELYDRLQRLQHPGACRSVRYARECGLISGATYFDQLLSDAADQRDSYFRAAFAALARRHVIFFDPDIGIEVSSTQRGQRGSARYIYWTELQEAYTTGHSLLVYQHFPRVERARFVPFLADALGEQLGASAVMAFVASHVSFFLVPQTQHGVALAKAMETMRLRWRGQIDVWQPIEEGL